MREFKRKQPERTKMSLVRGADGRLRAGEGYDDIGQIWAEQGRIRLREAIEADKLKAEKKKMGWRKFYSKKAQEKLAASGAVASVRKGESADPNTKTVEIKISMPKVKLPKPAIPPLMRALPKKLPRPSKKQLIVGASVVVCAVVALGGYSWLSGRNDPEVAQGKGRSSTLGAKTDDSPTYATVLPAGKKIEQLGGWGRVSPEGKDPVYAYRDTIDSVPVNVSEQPLPDSFKDDPDGQVAKLAESFGAKEKVKVGDHTIYIGTSINGPQSVITVRGETLILLKSVRKISNDGWAKYVTSLQ